MAVLPPLQNGQNIDADREMAWIKNGNYGTALKPMAVNGADADNDIALGSTTAKWSNTYTAGITAGIATTSAAVPTWRLSRFTLPAKNLMTNNDGANKYLMFTVDISSIGPHTNAIPSITLCGDDYNFSTGSGTILCAAQYDTQRSAHSGGWSIEYPSFSFKFTQGQVLVYRISHTGGYWPSQSGTIESNATMWDGTAQSRGWLDVWYVPL